MATKAKQNNVVEEKGKTESTLELLNLRDTNQILRFKDETGKPVFELEISKVATWEEGNKGILKASYIGIDCRVLGSDKEPFKKMRLVSGCKDRNMWIVKSTKKEVTETPVTEI